MLLDWAECPLPLFCVKPINLDYARPSGSRPRLLGVRARVDYEERTRGERRKYGTYKVGERDEGEGEGRMRKEG